MKLSHITEQPISTKTLTKYTMRLSLSQKFFYFALTFRKKQHSNRIDIPTREKMFLDEKVVLCASVEFVYVLFSPPSLIRLFTPLLLFTVFSTRWKGTPVIADRQTHKSERKEIKFTEINNTRIAMCVEHCSTRYRIITFSTTRQSGSMI